MHFLIQILVTGIMVGSIYSVLALGFVLIYKSSKVFNFSQGQFLLIGAYFGLMCLKTFHLSVWITLPLLCVFSFFMGYFCERLFMEKMIGQSLLASIMMTIAISYILEGASFLVWGGAAEMYPDIFTKTPVRIFSATVPGEYIVILGISILLVISLTVFFNHTKLGLGMKSTAESHEVSQSLGINVKLSFGMSWAIAALTGGVGGALLANINGVSPGFVHFGLKVFPVVILGGLESIPGAIIGGFILGMIEFLSMGYIDLFVPGFHSVILYIILILVLLVKPFGLFGLVRIERV